MHHLRQTFPDCTSDPKWIQCATDRLIAWEILQVGIGNSIGNMDEDEISDKIGARATFWYDTVRRTRDRIKKRRSNYV